MEGYVGHGQQLDPEPTQQMLDFHTRPNQTLTQLVIHVALPKRNPCRNNKLLVTIPPQGAAPAQQLIHGD